jgi:hypothetical protein
VPFAEALLVENGALPGTKGRLTATAASPSQSVVKTAGILQSRARTCIHKSYFLDVQHVSGLLSAVAARKPALTNKEIGGQTHAETAAFERLL